MKTFKLTVTEDELKALIEYHARFMCYGGNPTTNPFNTETSERIHTLTKRLNKETPEIEVEKPYEGTPPGPNPSRQSQNETVTHQFVNDAQEQSAVEQVKIPEGW
ncbi:MAG TPA: hypothetical protein VEP90_06730 [Methylomirabilota bacterium]|nr:hypothetical protein [Methylomirabilota bacterium]